MSVFQLFDTWWNLKEMIFCELLVWRKWNVLYSIHVDVLCVHIEYRWKKWESYGTTTRQRTSRYIYRMTEKKIFYFWRFYFLEELIMMRFFKRKDIYLYTCMYLCMVWLLEGESHIMVGGRVILKVFFVYKTTYIHTCFSLWGMIYGSSKINSPFISVG